MFFRNLTLFRFPESVAKSIERLPDDLEQHRLRECGPLELATRGFVSPYGRDSEVLVHGTGAFSLLAVGSEERLLPGVVVAEELADRIAKIGEKQGGDPARRNASD
jgi:recombination associated protein RdgC